MSQNNYNRIKNDGIGQNYISDEELEITKNSTEHIEDNEINDESELKDSFSTTIWLYSDINKLLDILAINWKLYTTNKTRFYRCAAYKLGNNKMGKQVKAKLLSLRTKYINEKKEVT
ncbi:2353_t:CDS:2, partial [Scutellospora calospora]